MIATRSFGFGALPCPDENPSAPPQSSISRRVFAGSCLASAALLGACATLTPDADMIEVSGAAGATSGTLTLGGRTYRCMLGRSGIVTGKREGDGGTPAGTFPLREVRYRADRMTTPRTGLPIHSSKESDGWCDAPGDPAYNRLVQLPYPADAEHMWREDHAYDVLAVIGYNDSPPVAGLGSAIFLHVARPSDLPGEFRPTAGCVSMPIEDVLAVLAACTPSTKIRIRLV